MKKRGQEGFVTNENGANQSSSDGNVPPTIPEEVVPPSAREAALMQQVEALMSENQQLQTQGHADRQKILQLEEKISAG